VRERDVRDRVLEVGPKGQGSECTEAGDLLGLPLVGVVPLIAVLKLHHIVFSLERLDLLCVILVNRVLKLLQMVVIPREVGFLPRFEQLHQALVGVVPDLGCRGLLTELASELLPLGLESVPGGHYKSRFMIMW
jgi:hypothetical protein